MSDKVVSYVLHAFAGAILVSAPLIMTGIPTSIQDMTIGSVIMMFFKWLHDYAGL